MVPALAGTFFAFAKGKQNDSGPVGQAIKYKLPHKRKKRKKKEKIMYITIVNF